MTHVRLDRLGAGIGAAVAMLVVLAIAPAVPVAGRQDVDSAGTDAETVDAIVLSSAATQGERAAAQIRGAVRRAANERRAAAEAGDADALAALREAEERLIGEAARVQLAGSELDQLQFSHNERVAEHRAAREMRDTNLAALYAMGPMRVVEDLVDGYDPVAATTRTVLLDIVLATDEERLVETYVASRSTVDVAALADERRAAEEVLVALRGQRGAAAMTSQEASAELDALAALADDVVFPISSDYNFVDTYLAPRMYGTPDAHRHQGTDIFAPEGTPLLAAERGIVVRIGQVRLGGNRLWLIGESGAQYYYAHLSGFADIQEGQFVEAGTVVGFVGNTGNARTTPPHLHIQVHPGGGTAVNPFPLLRQLADRDEQLVQAGLDPVGHCPRPGTSADDELVVCSSSASGA